MNPRSLLILASTYPTNPADGVPAFVRDLATFESEAFATTVVVPAVPGGRPTEIDGALSVIRFRYFFRRWEDLADGAILENLRSRPSRWLQVPFFFIAEFLAVRRAVRRVKPTVMHVHWLIPQGLVALLAAPRIPKVVTTLGGDLYGLKDPISRRLIRLVLRNATAATTMNSEMRDQLLALGSDPQTTHVLPMGADLKAISRVAETMQRESGRVLFVGRLVEKKGLAHLLEALRQLDLSGVQLRIVGDGPLRAELEEKASGLPVTFVGALGRAELAREYGAAAVAVFPSIQAASGDQDGLPVALLEAMGAGVPIIASRLPGLADAVEDGESGRLVAPGSASEIAEALHDLLSDDELRTELGKHAAEHAQLFSVEAIGERYVALLNQVCA
ncbi:Glycosyltransferase involved in cell wall bisynthesis [Frankineae bacterium MT45]|nr:Glycosyltransferase involved in cell wall bisynthesis [Frankineae bacterium MT45]